GTLAPGRRLACQARLCGDVVVDVPADSQVHRQVVRKSVDERPIAVDPVVHLHYVEVAQPDMNDPSGDARRLLTALGSQWGLEALELPLPVLHGLQKTLRDGNWAVTAAVRHGHEIVALFPGFHEAIAGIAVDIGSTTIAAHLCDLASGAVLASAGVMNPQIRFGEDLMSRVSYVMMNPGGREELTRAVRGTVDGLVGTLTAEARIARGDICEMTVVGNPIMHHLFLGLDPTELGGAPFALAADGPLDVPAREVGVAIAPAARVHVLPCIAGHVGADAAGVILAEGPHRGSRSSSTSAPTPRSCSATASGCSPARRRPGRRSRAPRSRPGSAPHLVRSSACASIPRRSSRASSSSAPTCGRTTRRSTPRPASRASAALASSR